MIRVFPDPARPTNMRGNLELTRMSMKYLTLIVSDVWTKQACSGMSGSSSNLGILSVQAVYSLETGSTHKSNTFMPAGKVRPLNSMRNHLLNSAL